MMKATETRAQLDDTSARATWARQIRRYLEVHRKQDSRSGDMALYCEARGWMELVSARYGRWRAQNHHHLWSEAEAREAKRLGKLCASSLNIAGSGKTPKERKRR